MDTSVLVAFVGVGGVLVGAALTFLSRWLARRSEQRRWVLDRRLEAFVDFNQVLSRCREGMLPADEQIAVMHDLVHASDRIQLVASPATGHQTHVVVGLTARTAAAAVAPEFEKPSFTSWRRPAAVC